MIAGRLPSSKSAPLPKPKVPQPAYTETEAAEWIETLAALRASFRKMDAPRSSERGDGGLPDLRSVRGRAGACAMGRGPEAAA